MTQAFKTFEQKSEASLPLVSIIVPAYNAQDTLEHTLSNLLNQSYQNWEAIIIDNNSDEKTFSIAREFSIKDSRYRVTIENTRGVSFARNAGITIARGEWLLFLDSDDWLHPEAIKELISAAQNSKDIDAVFCNSVRVAKDGTEIPWNFPDLNGSLFELFANRCGFPIHSCLIKKEIALKVNCFDTSIQFGEDWDFWQKAARTGAKFESLNNTLAYYRLRKGSAILNPNSFYQQHDILKRARTIDNRIDCAHPVFKNGINDEKLSESVLELLIYCSALTIGQKGDPSFLIKELEPYNIKKINYYTLAVAFYDLIPCALQSSQKIWPNIYQEYLPLIREFLIKLETFLRIAGTTRETLKLLDMYIIKQNEQSNILELETSTTIKIELSDPIEDIKTNQKTLQVTLDARYFSQKLWPINIPVINGIIPAEMLRDYVAEKYYWQIIQIYFEQKLYPKIEIKLENKKCLYLLDGIIIAQNYCNNITDAQKTMHQEVWWNLLLHQLKLAPSNLDQDNVKWVDKEEIRIELGTEIPSISSNFKNIRANIYLNDNFLANINLELNDKYLHSNLVKLAIVEATKEDFPRLYTSEVLLTQNPISQTKNKYFIAINNFPNSKIGKKNLLLSTTLKSSIIKAAAIFGQNINYNYEAQNQFIIFDSKKPSNDTTNLKKQIIKTNKKAKNERTYDREHFENLFASKLDPWNYESEYEKLKYEQTISILPKQKFEKVLELACAEGRFTKILKEFVEQLYAADISEIAISRAKKRCSDEIKFKQLDFTSDELGENYDLIVCSEALYSCMTKEILDKSISNISKSLKPGGYLVTANAVVYGEEPNTPGFNWPSSFGAKSIFDACIRNPELKAIKELRSAYYRINLFIKSDQQFNLKTEEISAKTNENIDKQFISSPEAKASIPKAEKIEHENMPVLLYHGITNTIKSDYEVTIDEFESQIKFLADTGYQSIDLSEWEDAVKNKKKLNKKPIIITFDDGYKNFYELAFPVLKKYNFSAIVFLVSDYVGQANIWDKEYLNCIKLLNWNEILELRKAGIIFGSHTLTHPRLNLIQNDEIIEQLYVSRAEIQNKLSESVDSLAYPYGNYNEIIRDISETCGYKFGFTTENKRASIYDDNLMAIPRIEICGYDTFSDFIKKITS